MHGEEFSVLRVRAFKNKSIDSEFGRVSLSAQSSAEKHAHISLKGKTFSVVCLCPTVVRHTTLKIFLPLSVRSTNPSSCLVSNFLTPQMRRCARAAPKPTAAGS